MKNLPLVKIEPKTWSSYLESRKSHVKHNIPFPNFRLYAFAFKLNVENTMSGHLLSLRLTDLTSFSVINYTTHYVYGYSLTLHFTKDKDRTTHVWNNI